MDESKDDGVEEIDAKAFDRKENQDDEAPIDDFGRRARANVSERRPMEEEAKVPVPTRFHKTVVHYPGCVMFVTGLIAIVLAGLAFGAGESELGGSFTDISNIKVRRLYGFFAFREDYWKATGREDYWRRRLSSDSVLSKNHGVSKATLARIPIQTKRSTKRQQRRRLDAHEDTTDHGAPRREEDCRFSVVVRARKSGDILGKGLSTLRRIHRRLTHTEGYDDYCLSEDGGATCVPPTSVFQGLANAPPPLSTCTNNTCGAYLDASLPTCDDHFGSVDQFATDAFGPLCESTDVYRTSVNIGKGRKKSFQYDVAGSASDECMTVVAAQRAFTVGGGWDCTSNKATYAKITYATGMPLSRCEGDCWDDAEEEEVEEWAIGTMMPRLHKLRTKLHDGESFKEADYDLVFDGACYFIDYYLANDQQKLLIAVIIVLIVLILQTKSVWIACCGLFEIVISFPIGLFVWVVIMQQDYVTYLMYNGVFIILGIGCDDIFVLMDAWKQSAMHPAREVRESLLLRFTWAYNRAASAMLATSVTTCAAFVACAVSPIWDIQCFGVVSAVMVFADYLLVITFLPAACIVRERYFPQQCKDCGTKACLKSSPVGAAPSSDDKVDEVRPPDAKKPRLVERFYGGPFADFIIKGKIPLTILFCGILVSSMIVWNLLLVRATSATDWFVSDHPFTLHDKATKYKFLEERTDEKESSWLVAGISEDDPWALTGGAHPACVEGETLDGKSCMGSAKYKGFDLAKHQQAWIDASTAYEDELRAQGASPHYESGHYNFMIDFKNYVLHQNLTFPYSPDDNDAFVAKLIEFRDSWEPPYGWLHLGGQSEYPGDQTGFHVEGNTIKAVFAGFNTTRDVDRDSFDELYDVHEGARAALKKAKQFLGGHIYQVTYYDDWMVASKAFYDSSRINIVTAFAFALIIMLCATANWIVTLIAFGSLVTTVSTTLALMVFYGWELNVIESIDVSIAGGMAVDYVLHMSHAYNHQDPTLTSSERVRLAMGEMGISVLSGCITTFGACCALFSCDLLWFKMFGYFICTLIMSSFVVSNFGMMALLALCGPTNGKGDVAFLKDPRGYIQKLRGGAPAEAVEAKEAP